MSYKNILIQIKQQLCLQKNEKVKIQDNLINN